MRMHYMYSGKLVSNKFMSKVSSRVEDKLVYAGFEILHFFMQHWQKLLVEFVLKPFIVFWRREQGCSISELSANLRSVSLNWLEQSRDGIIFVSLKNVKN